MKTITVIDTSIIKQGTSGAGNPWTLSEVTAVDKDGAPIEEKLKTFDDLQAGQSYDVDVEKEDHPKYGVSYMLKLPRDGSNASSAAPAPSAGARLGPKVDELRDRVEHLEDQVRRLNQAITDLGSGTLPASTPVTTTPAASAAFGGDDDIPF